MSTQKVDIQQSGHSPPPLFVLKYSSLAGARPDLTEIDVVLQLTVESMEQQTEYGAGVGHKIRKVRELRNLTQERVAEQLGMTTSGYSRIERGEVRISIERLEQVAHVLGVQPLDLTQFDESVFLTNYGTANDHSFNVVSDKELIDEIKRVYEARIADLKEEIAFLRSTFNR
jgi:transcriptional regulator with XRE-family HTH domain